MTHLKISSIEMSKDVLVLNQAGMDCPNCPIPDVYDEYKFINPDGSVVPLVSGTIIGEYFPEDGDKDAAKIQSAIDSAVAAERERCAKIAEEWEIAESGKPDPFGLSAEIRKGQ